MAALLQLGAALTLVGGAIGLKGSHAAAPRAGSAPASPRIDPYAVSWAVQGAQSFVCAGCDSAPFQPGGSADVSKFGLLGPNRTYVASWGSIFPTITSTGEPLNGGVPQATNLTQFEESLTQAINLRLPQPSWKGLIAYDFESWAPLWSDNLTPVGGPDWHSERYRAYSRALVAAAHPGWTAAQVEAQAKSDFERAALQLFVLTLRITSSMRPHATAGFYGMPGGSYTLTPANHQRALADARALAPVFEAAGALFPSLYFASAATTTATRSYRINATVAIARAAAATVTAIGARPAVLPFVWEAYSNGSSLLSHSDLSLELLSPYDYGADGLVIWGYSSAVANADSTAECGRNRASYLEYVRTETGPLLLEFKGRASGCARSNCSGNGRCITLLATDSPNPNCNCFEGFSGPRCNQTAGPVV